MLAWQSRLEPVIVDILVKRGLYDSPSHFWDVFDKQHKGVALQDGLPESFGSGEDTVRKKLVPSEGISEDYSNRRYAGLNSRQVWALGYLLKHHQLKTKTYMEYCNVSRIFADKELKDLIKRQIIEQVKTTSLPFYRLAPITNQKPKADRKLESTPIFRWLSFRPELRMHIGRELLKEKSVRVHNNTKFVITVTGQYNGKVGEGWSPKTTWQQVQGKLPPLQKHLTGYLTNQQWELFCLFYLGKITSKPQARQHFQMSSWHLHRDLMALASLFFLEPTQSSHILGKIPWKE